MSQDNIAFSGQLQPDQLAEVAQRGFKSVINNRPDYEDGPSQPTTEQMKHVADGLGLQFVGQPVVSGQITEQDVRTFAEHVNTLPKPIWVYCRSGARSKNLYQLALQLDLLDDFE